MISGNSVVVTVQRAIAWTIKDRTFLDYCEHIIRDTKRRQGWFFENLSFRKLTNMAIGATQFVFKSEKMLSWPVVVKIDISPLCNLRCTVCIHANPNGNEALEKQKFHRNQKMTVEQYRRIINQIKGKSSAVVLYYLGDPFVHPDVDEMCRIARDAGLNVHISTNFSFAFTDERIRQIVKSGLTHLTVCVDGLSQEKYQLTRVGGRIDLVLSNLKRVCQFKRESGQIYPNIEVQYLKFPHNLDQLEQAKRLFAEIGVDQITTFFGKSDNFTDINPDKMVVISPQKNKLLPQCYWPHLSMLIKYNGDVIPCCQHRKGTQYTNTDELHILGNVFQTSIREIWNSSQYRELRRLVSNPELVESETSLKKSFCYGCPLVFHVKHNSSGY